MVGLGVEIVLVLLGVFAAVTGLVFSIGLGAENKANEMKIKKTIGIF